MQLQLPVSLEPLLHAAALQLANVTDTPRDEAEWLLAELLDVPRAALRRSGPLLAAAVQARYAEALRRRAAGEPFAYVTGTQPFRRLTLQVSPAVLIPRPDTEHLVDWALECLRAAPATAVLDVCTGSGCVALALADETRDWPQRPVVWASDCSAGALAVARDNAQRLDRAVRFVQADALSLPAGTPRFGLITANPPYIAEHDAHLPALAHEPRLALVSGADGLDLLRVLIAQAPAHLLPQGWLLLEHGHDQGMAVRELLVARGFTQVSTRRDYGGNERISGGCWSGPHG